MKAIEITGVSKKFRRHAHRPRATTFMSYVLQDWRRRPDPVSDDVWALKDVDLGVEKGTTLGVIGRNGSGKSTLLKIMNKILMPDAGRVVVRGTTAALISLGAGFHPLLSGRDNVLINGIVLGLTKNEVKAKFDEIVEFAELEDYIDEPVRTYSTGMVMRLGFAVAVHVDPEILLLDEVLAVGDAAFSQKCKAKMDQFRLKNKTIVLVTHNLPVVCSWCDKAVWLHEGLVQLQGDPTEVVSAYTQRIKSDSGLGSSPLAQSG